MSDWTPLWARGSREQLRERPDSVVSHADALRNTNDSPPNRNGQPGPNGTRPPQPRNNGSNAGLGWLTRLLFIALLLIVGYNVFVTFFGSNFNTPTIAFAYSDFETQLTNGNIDTVTFEQGTGNISGTLKNSVTYTQENGQQVTGTHFTTVYPFSNDAQLQQQFAAANV
ncbi:MAG TPA: ATP-dependent metallopeptidase FtsH/Yme1/Tma family protein, partial [Ktedonobacterales bacterium]